jgi:hypothetical protein
MGESIIIRLASTDDADGELRGILEWVRSGRSVPFESGRRLVELLSVGPTDPVEADRTSG